MTGQAGRLLIDVSHTLGTPHYTGIQRYVRHTLRHAVALARPDQGMRHFPSVGAMAVDGVGRWRTVRALPAHPLEGLPPLRIPVAEESGVAELLARDGTHVLLADRLWHAEAWEALEVLLASPAAITLVVYDLISLRHPEWFAAGVGGRFGRYLRRVLPRVRQVVCLSETVRNDLRTWMAAEGIGTVPIRTVTPGHSVWSPPRHGALSLPMRPVPPCGLPAEWKSGRVRFVMQVGTLEPRKNHFLSWQAIQHLWAAGRSEGLLVIGQPGWLTGEFCRQLRQAATSAAPQVVWLEECTDAELDWCYRNAAAMLYPSSDEGYGLPLAEAAALGTPVIASDTVVHREVAERVGGPVYWTALHPAAIAAALLQVLDAAPAVPRMPAARSWAQATRELVLATGVAEARPPASRTG